MIQTIDSVEHGYQPDRSAVGDIAKNVQLYDLSNNKVISEMPHFSDVQYMEGDELEIPSVGAFKIVKRRWSISPDGIILVLILEPLA
jgi:hypothetical protein